MIFEQKPAVQILQLCTAIAAMTAVIDFVTTNLPHSGVLKSLDSDLDDMISDLLTARAMLQVLTDEKTKEPDQ